MKPFLGLCLIFRDEEKQLPEFLEYHKTLADEYILVDTGSRDSSQQIIEKYGYTIIEHIWQDDFSLARNQAIENCNSEWILFLDADERIKPEDGQKLRNILPEIQADGVFLPIHNLRLECWPSQSIIQSTCHNVRLFRNKPCYRYQGAIHEDIIGSIEKNNGYIVRMELPVWHLGYSQNSLNEKKQRNCRIIRKAWLENPEDPRLCLYYAGTLENQDQKAVDIMETAFERAKENGLRYQLAKQILLWYHKYQNGNKIKTDYWEKMLIDIHPDCFLIHLLRGRNFFAEKLIPEALKCYLKAYAGLEEVSEPEYHLETLDRLCLLSAMSGSLDESLKYNRLLKKRFGTNIHNWHFSLKLLYALKDYQAFLQELAQMPVDIKELDFTRKQEIAGFLQKLEFPDKQEILKLLLTT
jgi:glycosyltransferase involved in cell wall biosynthesis